MANMQACTLRVYSSSVDRETVVSFCGGVYGGSDYLPKRLDTLSSDPLSTCIVLQTGTGKVVAFANIRQLHAPIPGEAVPLFLEAVRVAPEEYRKGYGRIIVERGSRFAAERTQCVIGPVYSCTIAANKGMLRIFEGLNFKGLGRGGQMHVWPSSSAFNTPRVTSKPSEPMLDALGVSDSVTMTMKATMDEWLPVMEKADLWKSIEVVSQTDGGVGMVPSFLQVQSAEQVWNSICACAGSAWRLPDFSALVFVYEEPAVVSSPHRTMICVCTSSVEAAASAVVFADYRLPCDRFRAIFSPGLLSSELREAPLLADVDHTSFEVKVGALPV